MKYSLGFMKPSAEVSFGTDEQCFGAPGASDAFAIGDPKLKLGYAYVSNRFGLSLIDDERELAITSALYRLLNT